MRFECRRHREDYVSGRATARADKKSLRAKRQCRRHREDHVSGRATARADKRESESEAANLCRVRLHTLTNNQ